MYFKQYYKNYEIDDEFQIKPGVRNTYTIQTDGLEADENGDVLAHKGSFIDKDGKVIKLTDCTSIPSDPIGILTETLNLRYGPQPGSVLRSGEIQAKYLYYPDEVEYEESFDAIIESKLPHILCMGAKNPTSMGGGAAGAGAPSSTVDLSKATGTLAVKNGGTGATSADAALEALGGQKKLSDPLPIANGGTGASDAESALTALGGAKDSEFQKVKATVEEQHPE